MRLGFAALLSLVVVAVPSVAHAQIEDYASYDAPKKCHAKPRAGTDYLGHWVARHFGGGYVGYGRPCDKKDGPTSEHQTGQAFDWSLDASKKRDRRTAKDFLHRIFEKDARGNTDAWARRMGIMYLIWDDEMYPAWNEFRPEPYLSSGCTSKKKCSKTLRHRNHVHVSLDMDGAKGRTSWFEDRL
ncbi:hypothetical protein ABLE68_04875 [Nocardioides sp. CN2-186]|uniref:hypothetical protein n=1 Tax=Nocardioides tweenelious TaxID=3156607 RepID=UPI0032B479E4